MFSVGRFAVWVHAWFIFILITCTIFVLHIAIRVVGISFVCRSSQDEILSCANVVNV